MSQITEVSYSDYVSSGKSYTQYKDQIKLALAQVDSFHLKFKCPTLLGSMKHVKPGSNRKCVRVPGASHFLMSNTRIIVSAATVAHLVTKNEADFVPPPVKDVSKSTLPPTGPTAQ